LVNGVVEQFKYFFGIVPHGGFGGEGGRFGAEGGE
jgi:hypothetical protein